MAEIRGIDVSKHQGTIDWNKVKASGIEFAFIRIGWTWYDGGITMDEMFIKNYNGAKAAGLKVGVYVYSYDRTVVAASKAADALINILKDYKIDYPIVFDIEDAYNKTLTKKVNTDIVSTFLDKIEKAGYYAMIYTFVSFANSNLDMSALSRFDTWIAHWGVSKPNYSRAYSVWQYSNSGTINGINSSVDLNYAYKDLAARIKEKGLNHLDNDTVTKEEYDRLVEENKKLKDKIEDAKDTLADVINNL